MTDYIGKFIGSWPDQPLLLLYVGLTWLLLMALGSTVFGSIGGGRRLREADALYGWAAVCAVFIPAGVFPRVPMHWLGLGLAATAVAGTVLWTWRRDRPDWRALLPWIILTLPLFALVSAMVPSQWDEFSHWLASPRFLFETGGFPHAGEPETGASYPAYPYGWPFLAYLASRLAGTHLESAGGVFNLILLLTFGALALRLLDLGLARTPAGGRPGWSLVALGILFATLLNPTFAQKVALTAYADVATAVSMAFAGVLGWLMLTAETEGDHAAARGLAWQMALVLIILVSLKQATFVLFVLIVGAVFFAGLRDPAVRLAALLKLLPIVVIPPLLIYLTWRYHVATELTAREFTIRPISGWYIDIVPQILARMLLVFSKKGVYFALMLAALGFGLRALIKGRTPFDRLAIIVAACFLGYNGFLLFAYISSFGKFDALRVASLWRYNMHLGLLGVAFAVYGGAILWRRLAPRLTPRLDVRRLAWLPVVLLVVAQLAFAKKIRFDLEPPKPHLLAVTPAARALVTDGSRLSVIDPTGTGESGVMARYFMGRKVTVAGHLSAFQHGDAENIRGFLSRRRPDWLLVHSVTPQVKEVINPNLATGFSYLLGQDGKGGWNVVKTWPYPK